jgi:hypothetical protein
MEKNLRHKRRLKDRKSLVGAGSRMEEILLLQLKGDFTTKAKRRSKDHTWSVKKITPKKT